MQFLKKISIDKANLECKSSDINQVCLSTATLGTSLYYSPTAHIGYYGTLLMLI